MTPRVKGYQALPLLTFRLHHVRGETGNEANTGVVWPEVNASFVSHAVELTSNKSSPVNGGEGGGNKAGVEMKPG